MGDITVNKAIIRRGASVMWEEPPAHYDAFSKMLVRPENAGTKQLDFRISSYQPKGYVAPHKHAVQEQIYHMYCQWSGYTRKFITSDSALLFEK